MGPKLGCFRSIVYPIIQDLTYLLFIVFPYAPVRREGHRPEKKSGPKIWAPTHSNFFCDIGAIGREVKPPPKFIAKHGLFRFPIKSFVLFCGGVPVVRPEDIKNSGGDRTQNRRSFEQVIAAMNEGWDVCIFPEGTSLEVPGLLPLKAGVAKLALAAEASANFKMGLEIIPVAFEYGSRKIVASGLTIRYGKAIAVANYQAEFLKNPVLAERKIVEDLEAEMKQNFPDFATWDDYHLGHSMKLAGLVGSKRHAACSIKALSADAKKLFIEKFNFFIEKTKVHKLPLWSWEARREWLELSRRQRFMEALGLFLGIPLLPWYLVNNFMADRALIFLANKISTDETEFMATRVMLAPLVLLLLYEFQFNCLVRFGLLYNAWSTFAFYGLFNILNWYFFPRWKNIFWRHWGNRKFQLKRIPMELLQAHKSLLDEIKNPL